MKLGLAQTKFPEDGRVLSMVDRFAAQAAAEGVELLVFPEALQTRYELPAEEFIAQAQPIGGDFNRGVDSIAAKYGLWIAYTINEQHPDFATGAKPYNTAVIVDAEGKCQGTYRKVHLFDVGSRRESDKMSAGNALFEPIQTPWCKLGLAICYDLRFPEVARKAALGGCQLMLYPAAWVDGPLKKEHWQTLLRARAIENEMFVAGLSRCDEGRVGSSCVFGPDGVLLAEAGCDECLLTADIDFAAMEPVRANMPVLEHRRPELY